MINALMIMIFYDWTSLKLSLMFNNLTGLRKDSLIAIEWLPLFKLQNGVSNLYLWFQVHHEFEHRYLSLVYISLLYHTQQFFGFILNQFFEESTRFHMNTRLSLITSSVT